MSTPAITAEALDVIPVDGELSDEAIDALARLLIDAATTASTHEEC